MDAAASITCSQLSRTSRNRFEARAVATRSGDRMPVANVSPSPAATVIGTSLGSVNAPSSAIQTPSGNFGCMRRAASTPSRVLPMPPAPVSVTRRRSATRPRISRSSASRPMSSDTASGRLVRAAAGAMVLALAGIPVRTVPVNWYPRPATVRTSSRSSANAFRSAAICTWRLFSSTTLSGHTRAISSSLPRTLPPASTSAMSRSNARAPSSTGWQSTRSSRRRGRTATRPNSMIVDEPDSGFMG